MGLYSEENTQKRNKIHFFASREGVLGRQTRTEAENEERGSVRAAVGGGTGYL